MIILSDTKNNFNWQKIDVDVLSLYDVSSEGKVVSANVWDRLWKLVFNNINTIGVYCTALNEIQLNWQHSEQVLNEMVVELEEKYAALKDSFVHYGKEPPSNEHVKLWVQPVEKANEALYVTQQDLNNALADKVVAFTTMYNTLLVPFDKVIALETNSSYLIERYRAGSDLTSLRVQHADGFMTNTAQFVVPTNTNITMIYTRHNNGEANGSFTARVTVLFDSPILYTPSYYNNEVCTGYYTFTATVEKDGTIRNSKIDIKFYETADTTMISGAAKITTATLRADAWTTDATGAHVQTLGLANITNKSKIDLNLTVAQLVKFHQKDIAFVIANESKVVKVYCVGQKPTEDYTVQLTITEVVTI